MASKPTWAASPQEVKLLPRNAVHDMIETLIRRLDLEDGDPDLEETDAEDSFALSWYATARAGAGCPIADPGELDGDETDGNSAEDEPAASHKRWGNGAGCVIADSDWAVDDKPCDPDHEDGH